MERIKSSDIMSAPESLQIPEDCQPGLNVRTLNYFLRLEEPLSLGEIWSWYKENPQGWFDELRKILGERRPGVQLPGEKTRKELEGLFRYLEWCDEMLNSGNNIPKFEIKTGNNPCEMGLIYRGRNFGLLPVLDRNLAAALGKALGGENRLVVVPQNFEERWEKEIDFLKKYYGWLL
jgi:hypothetical protein